MKNLLFLPALLYCSSAALAQTSNCAAVQTENAALKDKLVAYEARLGIGVGGVTVQDGDPTLKVKFLSCKASKATHRAVLTYLVTNTGEPQPLQIQPLYTTYNPSMVVDEQGQAFTSSSEYTPTIGTTQMRTTLPTNVPVNGKLTFVNVPLTTTRLNSVVLSFMKTPIGGGKEEYFKTTIKNMPVTWLP
jgi:hypothetical protein